MLQRESELSSVVALGADVTVGLCEVEHRASVGGVPLELRLQQLGVAPPSPGAQSADRLYVDRHARQSLTGALRIACDVLVRGSDVAPLQATADQPLVVKLDLPCVTDQVGVGRQASERAGADLDRPVGVEEQEVLAPAAGKLHQFAAVVAEVDPPVLVKLAGDPRELAANQILRAVGGPGVADHPVVDQLTARVKQRSRDATSSLTIMHRQIDGRPVTIVDRVH